VSHRAVKRIVQCAVHHAAAAELTTESRRSLWRHTDCNFTRWQQTEASLTTSDAWTNDLLSTHSLCHSSVLLLPLLLLADSWQWQSPPCYRISVKWSDDNYSRHISVKMCKIPFKIRRLAHIRINNHKFWYQQTNFSIVSREF